MKPESILPETTVKIGKNKGPKILRNEKSRRSDQQTQCHSQSLSIVDNMMDHPNSPCKTETLIPPPFRNANSYVPLQKFPLAQVSI